MKIIPQLQLYDDGTYGYLGIDGNYNSKDDHRARVVCTQGEDEYREQFIRKNRLSFDPGQYGSNESLDMLVNGNVNDKIEAAEHKHALDVLMFDRNYKVRVAVAKQGYRLDRLINDSNVFVRAEVARQGYGLYQLLKDYEKEVRVEIAKHGFNLDQLFTDRHPEVVQEVYKYMRSGKMDDETILDILDKFSNYMLKNISLGFNFVEKFDDKLDTIRSKSVTKILNLYEDYFFECALVAMAINRRQLKYIYDHADNSMRELIDIL